MLTYPSTYGIFDDNILEVIDIIHIAGGQIYLDGANMNAMCGLIKIGDFGADVCHLNLHKTFCIPHGGGGPGVGTIGFMKHLAPFVPGHSVLPINGRTEGAVSGSPWGNAGVLPIAYSYIKMSGKKGLLKTSQMAILNANYIATKLSPVYNIKYKSDTGRVAHEVIIDVNELK